MEVAEFRRYDLHHIGEVNDSMCSILSAHYVKIKS